MKQTLKFITHGQPQALLPNAPQPPAPAELLVYGQIGDSFFDESVTAKDVIAQIQDAHAPAILVRINSQGGSVADGLAIYNALQSSGAQITTRVEGVAASIASLIAMAGNSVEMHENALMMVHAPYALTQGNAEQLRKFAQVLDAHAKAMATSYAAKTGKSADDVLAQYLDGPDHWFTAAEAKDEGLTDTVIERAPAEDPAQADARAQAIAAAFSTYGVTALGAQLITHGAHAATPLKPAAQIVASTPAASAAHKQVQPMNWNSIAAALGIAIVDGTEDATIRALVMAHLKLDASADDAAVAAALVSAKVKAPAPAVKQPEAVQVGPTREAQIEQMFGIALRGARASNVGLTDLRDRCLIDASVSVDVARERLLQAMNNGATPLAGTHTARIEAGDDQVDKRREAMTQATLARVGKAKADGANPYRGYRLLDMARASLEDAGINVRGMRPTDIAHHALSPRILAAGMNTTSDFPVVLENTMHKLVLAGFGAVAPTWQAFAHQGDVSDFRAWNRLVPGLIGNLDDVSEGGDYAFKNLPDATQNSVTATRHGNIIRITPETLVNDDTGYINNVATGLGMAGARTIERAVYKVLVANPTLSDGDALFSSAHGNIASSGAAPGTTTLDAARQAMAKQKFPGDDAEYMDLKPAIAVAETSVEGTMRVVIASPFDPDSTNKLQRPNMVNNLVATIVGTPRIAASSWYVFADPAVAPVIEVVFLDGQRTPELRQEEHFESGALQWRVELPFGVGAIDYRGGYFNAGA